MDGWPLSLPPPPVPHPLFPSHPPSPFQVDLAAGQRMHIATSFFVQELCARQYDKVRNLGTVSPELCSCVHQGEASRTWFVA